MTREARVCSECGWGSPADGTWCENCGRLLVNLIESGSQEQTRFPMTQMGSHLVHLSDDLDYGPKLRALETRFNQAVAKRKSGSLYWELIGRHVEAYEIQKEVDLAERSLRRAWTMAFAQIEAQKAQAVVNFHQQQIRHELEFHDQQFQQEQEQLNHEFIERLKDRALAAKIDRYFTAIAQLEQRALTDGQLSNLDPEINREVLMRLVNKIEIEIFGSIGTRDSVVILE